MNISRQSLEIILDLIEIKVSALQIHDKDDARELNKLRKCKQELTSFINDATPVQEKAKNSALSSKI